LARKSRAPARRRSGQRRPPREELAYRSWAGISIIATIAGVVLVFWRGAVDVFSTPKLTLAIAGAALVLALLVLDFVANRRILLPRGPWPVLAASFAIVVLIVSVASGLGVRSLLGSYTRYVGAGPYLLFVALGLAVLVVADEAWTRKFVTALMLTAAVVVLYGLAQAVGADPFSWSADEKRTAFSTLGQENFAAGFIAIAVPIVAIAALDTGRSTLQRRVALATMVGALLMLWRSRSFQGAVVVVGLSPIAILEARSVLDRSRQRLSGLLSLIAALCVGLIVIVPLLARFGFSEVRVGITERSDLWRTAIDMTHGRLIAGRGYGAYALEFAAHRPFGFAQRYGGLQTSDAPHNIYLEHLVSGGLLVLAIYLALQAVTGWHLVKGLRRARGAQQLTLAGIGGAWLAYLGQGFVSIDVPPLGLLGFVLSGLIVALTMEVPAMRLAVPALHRVPVALAASVLAALLAVGLVVGSRPLRADAREALGTARQRRENIVGAFDALSDATNLAPWEASYHARYAAALQGAGRPDDALEPAERAARLGRDNTINALAYAALLKRVGRIDEAKRWYDEAVRHDPFYSGAAAAAGGFYLEVGDYRRAARLLKTATSLTSDNADYWALYGDALLSLGDRRGARAAYETSLRYPTESRHASEGLARLDGSTRAD
jgi:tetratricopeptide (TPR) repeat protein